MAEIVPEGDAELSAGQQQAGEGVPALASLIGAGTAEDLALDHLWAQVALRAIGIERHLGGVDRRPSLGHDRNTPTAYIYLANSLHEMAIYRRRWRAI